MSEQPVLNTEQSTYRVVQWTFECGTDKWSKWYVLYDGNVVSKHPTQSAAQSAADLGNRRLSPQPQYRRH